jgi:hypothetical protein
MSYDVRCSRCGHFCSVYDRGTMYGDSYRTEPPEEELFCKPCAEKEYDEILKRGKALDCWWMKPEFVVCAEKELKRKKKRSSFVCPGCGRIHTPSERCGL